MRIILTRAWLARASDEDVLWLFARAEQYGWEVLVK
jgi:hypothetical protein